MEADERLREVIAAAIAKHKSDLDATIREAANNLRALGDAEIDAICWRRGVAEFVHDKRHAMNMSIWANNRKMPGDPKVIAGRSETVSAVGTALSEYEFKLAGRILGDIYGNELDGLAASEEALSAGHTRNATLLRRLRAIVPDNKTVRQAVKPRKLKQLFVEVQLQRPDRLAG